MVSEQNPVLLSRVLVLIFVKDIDEQHVKVCFLSCIAMLQCILICNSLPSHGPLTAPFFVQFLDGWVIFAEYARPRAPPEQAETNSQPQQSWGAPSSSWGAQ